MASEVKASSNTGNVDIRNNGWFMGSYPSNTSLLEVIEKVQAFIERQKWYYPPRELEFDVFQNEDPQKEISGLACYDSTITWGRFAYGGAFRYLLECRGTLPEKMKGITESQAPIEKQLKELKISDLALKECKEKNKEYKINSISVAFR